MENKRNWLILLLAFITLNVYLFASAPEPLADKKQRQAGKLLPVEHAFALLAQENDAARTLYTKSIVGGGQAVNLAFREDWKDKEVEAGPLPALFLRGTANYLERNPLPLSLFLGSDYPISSSNKFAGIQEDYFEQMKKDTLPKYFFDENTKLYTAMFPDIASVKTCVSCHNEHADSPKKDWKIGDIMGATTWTYPADSVSAEKILEMIAVYRKGVDHTYKSYLQEVDGFNKAKKPVIGKNWPSQGYFLPAPEAFMDSASAVMSPKTLNKLLHQLQ